MQGHKHIYDAMIVLFHTSLESAIKLEKLFIRKYRELLAGPEGPTLAKLWNKSRGGEAPREPFRPYFLYVCWRYDPEIRVS